MWMSTNDNVEQFMYVDTWKHRLNIRWCENITLLWFAMFANEADSKGPRVCETSNSMFAHNFPSMLVFTSCVPFAMMIRKMTVSHNPQTNIQYWSRYGIIFHHQGTCICQRKLNRYPPVGADSAARFADGSIESVSLWTTRLTLGAVGPLWSVVLWDAFQRPTPRLHFEHQ
jgi:hypothetical protein